MSPKFEKIVYLFFIIVAIAGICYVLSSYGGLFLSIILPFLISGICAHFLSPPSQFLIKKVHFPKWVAHIFVVLSFFAALLAVSYILISRFLGELSGLSEYLVALKDSLPEFIGKVSDILDKKAGLSSFSDGITNFVASGADSFLTVLAQKLASYAPGLCRRSLPLCPRCFFSPL